MPAATVCTLVTGATGFVGRRLLRRLAERPELELHGLARRPPEDPLPGVEYHAADLTDSEGTFAELRPVVPRRVYHLAGMANPADCAAQPQVAYLSHVMGAQNLLLSLQGLDVRVVFASSAQVYGPQPPGPISEEAQRRPTSVYGRAKRGAEAVFERVAGYRGWEVFERERRAFRVAVGHSPRPEGVEVVIARPFNHSAAEQDPRYVLPGLAAEIRRALREGGPVRTGNLHPRRDFLHVEDVLDAYELLMDAGATGCAYNVCRGSAVSIGEVLEGLQRRLGAALPAEPDPALVREDDPEEITGDNHRLVELGWSPRVSMDELLDEVAGATGSP